MRKPGEKGITAMEKGSAGSISVLVVSRQLSAISFALGWLFAYNHVGNNKNIGCDNA